jgi:hypothetical protein
VVDHRVVIRRLIQPAAGALCFRVRPEMHVCRVQPHKNGVPSWCCRLMSFAAATIRRDVSVRFRVSGPVSSIFCLPIPARLLGCVVLVHAWRCARPVRTSL